MVHKQFSMTRGYGLKLRNSDLNNQMQHLLPFISFKRQLNVNFLHHELASSAYTLVLTVQLTMTLKNVVTEPFLTSNGDF